ncbi:MAG: DNA polymerase Y family protein [Rhizobiales bacterium]|jgi:protein ImuB|nr:DNA polymerase Y family protein [Hyphomicrobiales bacterium]
MGQRILALWFPHLATDRILRRRLGQSWRSPQGRVRPGGTPLLVSRREVNARRIAALDERAEALGLKRGMGIADACAMHPGIEIVEADPTAERRLLESLADWCDRYTPLVALDGEDGLFLDTTGCAHLFGGERSMLDELLACFLRLGFDARAGLASTVGAAWAAARFFASRIVEAGEEEAFLTPLPLAALRIDASVRAGLEGVGLRTAGAVMSTPRAPLARRFGRELLLRMDQALGRLEETISPRRPAPPLAVERRLAEPIVAMEAVEHLVGQLAVTLRSDLERRGEGARALELALFRVDGAVSRVGVGAARPLREPDRIGLLFHERLAVLEDRIDAGFGFDLVRLSAFSLAPFEARQADLSGEDASGEERLALFADRIRARLGDHAVLKAVSVESHLPERAVAAVPFAGKIAMHEITPCPVPSPQGGRGFCSGIRRRTSTALARETAAASPSSLWGADRDGGKKSYLPDRPIRLFSSPEPIEAIAAEVPEGAPASFRWRRVFHRVAASEGPERIAPEWWRADGSEGTRDYFRVEDEEGRRFWLYRQGLYGELPQGPRWFMHGIFA